MIGRELRSGQIEVVNVSDEGALPGLVGLEREVALSRYVHAQLGITPEDIEAVDWDQRADMYGAEFVRNPRGALWTAEVGETIVGFVAASNNESSADLPGPWIRNLCVRDASGAVGSALLETAEDWLAPHLGDDLNTTGIKARVATHDYGALDVFRAERYTVTGESYPERLPGRGDLDIPHTLLLKGNEHFFDDW